MNIANTPGNHENTPWYWDVAGVLIGVAAAAMILLSGGIEGAHASLLGGAHDQMSFVWILKRLTENIEHFPASLHTLFDGRMFFPRRDSLLFSESMPLCGPIFAVLYRLTGELPFAYNSTVTTLLFLNYVATYVVMRRFLSPIAAVAGGLIFGFSSVRLAHLNHFHVLPQFLYPIAALLFFEAVRSNRWSLWAALGAVVSLQVYLSVTLGVMLSTGALVPCLYVLMYSRTPMSRRTTALRMAVSGGVFVLLTLPLYLAYRQTVSFPHHWKDAIAASANIKSFLVAPPGNFYASFLVDSFLADKTTLRFEKCLFFGFSVMYLAVVGIRTLRKKTDDESKYWFRLTLASLIYGVWLSQGTNGGLFTVLFYCLPGVSALRSPGRFGLLILLIVAGLAAVGLEACLKRFKPNFRPFFIAAITGVFWLDTYFPIPHKAAWKSPKGVISFLAHSTDDNHALAYLYLQKPTEEEEEWHRIYNSLFHSHPLVGGIARWIPPENDVMNNLLSDALQCRSSVSICFQKLRDAGIGYVIIQRKNDRQPWGMEGLPWRRDEKAALIYEDDDDWLLKIRS